MPVPWRFGILGAVFVGSVVVAVEMVRPVGSGSVGPDAVAPVIELQRLLAGQQVEGHLTQTSKPLLDLIYGVLYSLSNDWRPVVWSAIFAFALSVVLATVLAHRVGGLASGAFAAFAFALSPILLVDLSLAYAICWMVLFLLTAGLAVTDERPRYGLAGLALMFAVLVRPEVLAVVAVALGALIAAETAAIAGHRTRPPRAAYLTLIGFVALPILVIHDALVFGDPLFWATTAQANSEGRDVRSLVEMVAWMGHHFIGDIALLPLAAAAIYVLISRRRWALAVGLAGVVGGITVLFIAIGIRGTFLSDRYLVPIDLGLLFAAAIGVAVLDAPEIRRWARGRLGPGRGRRCLVPIAGGLLVALALAPIGPSDAVTRASIATQIRLHANAQRAFATIRANLLVHPSWRGQPASRGFAAHPLLIVPPALRAQAVAELDLPLTDVAYSYAPQLDPARGRPTAGTIVYHDRLGDSTSDPRYAFLEIDRPTIIDGLRYVPLLVDRTAGIWVLRVESTGTP